MAQRRKAEKKTLTLVRRADGKWTIREAPQASGWALLKPDGEVLLLDRNKGRGRPVIAHALAVAKVWVGAIKDRQRPIWAVPRREWGTTAPIAQLMRVVQAAASARYVVTGSDEAGWNLTRSGAKVPLAWRGRRGAWRVTTAPGVRAQSLTELVELLGFVILDQAADELGVAPAAPSWLLLARRSREISRAKAIHDEQERLQSLSPDAWAAHLRSA